MLEAGDRDAMGQGEFSHKDDTQTLGCPHQQSVFKVMEMRDLSTFNVK